MLEGGEDLAFVAGLYFARGTAAIGDRVTFCIGGAEKDKAHDLFGESLGRLVPGLRGVDIAIGSRRNVVTVRNAEFADRITGLVGSSRQKMSCRRILGLPEPERAAFFSAGSLLSKTGRCGSLSFLTHEVARARGLQLAARSLGIFGRFHGSLDEYRTWKDADRRPLFSVSWSTAGGPSRMRRVGDLYAIEIKSVERFHYEGPVHDFTMRPEHPTLCTTSMIVSPHCGVNMNIAGSPTFDADGIPVARVGDPVTEFCGSGVNVSGSGSFFADGD